MDSQFEIERNKLIDALELTRSEYQLILQNPESTRKQKQVGHRMIEIAFQKLYDFEHPDLALAAKLKAEQPRLIYQDGRFDALRSDEQQLLNKMNTPKYNEDDKQFVSDIYQQKIKLLTAALKAQQAQQKYKELPRNQKTKDQTQFHKDNYKLSWTTYRSYLDETNTLKQIMALKNKVSAESTFIHV